MPTRTRAGMMLVVAACVAGCLTGCGGSDTPDPLTRIDYADIPRLKKAVNEFKKDCGRYPTNEEGLRALIEAPGGLANKWQGPYLEDASEESIKDPYGHVYFYTFKKTRKKERFRIKSVGPDGQEGNEDDYPLPKTKLGARPT